MVLQLTCRISYNKHHINKIGLHNTKYQTVTELGKQNNEMVMLFTLIRVSLTFYL